MKATSNFSRAAALLAVGLLGLLSASGNQARAQTAWVSMTGSFSDPLNAREDFYYDFPDAAPASTTFRTWAFDGGTNAADDVIPPGGIDSIIEVFGPANNSLGYNDDFPSHRDSLLSDSGSGLTYLPPLGQGSHRLNLVNYEYATFDGRWAFDVSRSAKLRLVDHAGAHSVISSIKFGGAIEEDAAELLIDAGKQFNVSAAVEIRSGGALKIQGGSLQAGTLKVDATASLSDGSLTVTGNVQVTSTGSISYASGTFAAGLLELSGGAVLCTPGGDKLVRAGGINVSSIAGGKLDLSDNDAIVGTGTTTSAVAELVRTARNGGTWDGNGITSSAAQTAAAHNTTLGVLTGAEYSSVGGDGTFAGQLYSATDTLVKCTWYGDTDFNGIVGFDDYTRIDQGFNLGRTGWLNGDFDYSGVVGFDDYSLIDLAFNTQSGTLARAISFLNGADASSNGMNAPSLQLVELHLAQFGPAYARSFLAAMPEPTSFGLIVLIVVGGALRPISRRRRGIVK